MASATIMNKLTSAVVGLFTKTNSPELPQTRQPLSVYANYVGLTVDMIDTEFNKHLETHNKVVELIKNTESETGEVITSYIDYLDNDFQKYFGLSQLHKSSEIRDKLKTLNTQYDKMCNELNNRELYEHINKYLVDPPKTNANFGEKVNPDEVKYFLTTVSNKLKLSGILSSNWDTIKANNDKISELSNDVNQILNNWDKKLLLSGSVDKILPGMPSSYVVGHRITTSATGESGESGEYEITTQMPDIFPILTKCDNRETRRKVYEFAKNKGNPDTISKIHEILRLRAKNANLITGNPITTHSDIILGSNLYKSLAEILPVLNSNKASNKPDVVNELRSAIQSVNSMLVAKYADTNADTNGDTNADTRENILIPVDSPGLYDLFYLQTQLKEMASGVSMSFTADEIVSGVTQFYSSFFGLTFVDNTETVKPTLWSDDIKVLEVYDNTNNEYLGSIYLDIYAREGKFGHAACFQLEWADRNTRHNKCAMVTNFRGDTSGAEQQLSFNDFETFLHEFGHCMHVIMNQTTIKCINSFSVEKDFIEVPSMLFQEFAYNPTVLSIVCPKLVDNIDKIKSGKQIFKKVIDARQLAIALYDLKIHSLTESELQNTDMNSEFEMSMSECLPILSYNNLNINECASFAHIISGYDCGYYGYLVSESVANSLYQKYFINADNDTICKNGQILRDTILRKGGSMSGTKLLESAAAEFIPC